MKRTLLAILALLAVLASVGIARAASLPIVSARLTSTTATHPCPGTACIAIADFHSPKSC